jgi:hypothetical protein
MKYNQRGVQALMYDASYHCVHEGLAGIVEIALSLKLIPEGLHITAYSMIYAH